jgi:spermine oxidase
MHIACRRGALPGLISIAQIAIHRRNLTAMRATTPSTQPPQPCKVVIIGAGFAGLAAGTTLCNNYKYTPTTENTDSANQQQPQKFNTEEVVILEASDRVGGRACTLPLSDILSVELGCTWIHGVGTIENPNPVLAVAAAAGLMPTTPQPQKWWGSTFLVPGRKEELTKEEKLLVHKAIEAYAAAVEGIESKEAEKCSTTGGENQGKGREVQVVGAAIDAAWPKFLQKEQLDSSKSIANNYFELARAAWQWREQLQRAIDGCNSTHDMEATARSLYAEYGESEIHAPIPCGYQKVAEALANGSQSVSLASSPPMPTPLNIQFNHEVELIEWGNNGYDNYVLITCTNGARFQASAAVVTTSLGVLKQQHKKMFSPNLPERKVQAIENLKIGVVDKIIIDFSGSGEAVQEEEVEKVEEKENGVGNGSRSGTGDEKIFDSYLKADSGVVTYALLWEDEEELPPSSNEDLPIWARGIFSIRWGGPELKRKRRKGQSRAGEVKNDEDEQEEESNEESEHHKDEFPSSSSSISLPPKYSQAVMWITGDAARSMEAASDIEVLKTIQKVFKKFPGIALPLVDNNKIDEERVWRRAKLIRSQWGLNPFTAGSYSYVGPTGSPDDIVALAAPIAVRKDINGNTSGGGHILNEEKPVLLFAGEACHVQYIGTTHAAYITGKEAAERLLPI